MLGFDLGRAGRRVGITDIVMGDGAVQPGCEVLCPLPSAFMSCREQKRKLNFDSKSINKKVTQIRNHFSFADWCSHSIVKEYAAEFLDPARPKETGDFTGLECSSYRRFSRGQCDRGRRLELGSWLRGRSDEDAEEIVPRNKAWANHQEEKNRGTFFVKVH